MNLFWYYSPPDNDAELYGDAKGNSYGYDVQLKAMSKQYREVAEAMIQDLNARGNIQFFALTLHSYRNSSIYEDVPGKAPPNTWLEVTNNTSLKGNGFFAENVGTILRTLARIDLLECIFISQEYHKEGELKGLPHYHLFVAVRSLFGTEGNYLQAAIQGLLTHDGGYFDCQLRRLHTFLDQKKYFNYLIKENKVHYHGLYTFSRVATTGSNIGPEYLYRFISITSDVALAMGYIGSYLTMPTEVPIDYLKLSRLTPFPDHRLATGSLQSRHLRCCTIDPPPGESITVDSLVYYLLLYCQFNGYFLCRGSLYRRRKEARFAYELVSTLDGLLNDLGPLYTFLQNEFPFQFDAAQNYVRLAFSRYLPDLMVRIRKSSVGLFPTVKLNYHLVEFRNGIYNKRIGQFLAFVNYSSEQIDHLPFNCYLYFDRYFDSSPRMVPHRWLSLLRPQFSSDQELDQFCARFAVLFHGDSIQEKVLEMDKQDRALYVEGVSNSGKTRLLADVVRAIAGPENIGLLGSSDNFPLETATDKQVLVADEYRYKSIHRDLLLRMLDGTSLPLDQKHKAQEIISIVAPVLFLANADRNQSMLTDEAFRSRLHHYRFGLVVDHQDLSPLETVEQELHKILLYCNRLFLNHYGDKFPELVRLRTHFRSRKELPTKRLRAQGFLLGPLDRPNS
ncbi:MAG: hypothetical protein ACK53T_21560 [Planctomycetota bacterium]